MTLIVVKSTSQWCRYDFMKRKLVIVRQLWDWSSAYLWLTVSVYCKYKSRSLYNWPRATLPKLIFQFKHIFVCRLARRAELCRTNEQSIWRKISQTENLTRLSDYKDMGMARHLQSLSRNDSMAAAQKLCLYEESSNARKNCLMFLRFSPPWCISVSSALLNKILAFFHLAL